VFNSLNKTAVSLLVCDALEKLKRHTRASPIILEQYNNKDALDQWFSNFFVHSLAIKVHHFLKTPWPSPTVTHTRKCVKRNLSTFYLKCMINLKTCLELKGLFSGPI